MSRKRKRIAAATLLMVSVLGLGLAGYIGATRASGMDLFAGQRDGSGFHRYRLNHQVGNGSGSYVWGGNTHNAQDESLRFAGNTGPGSAEPEKADDSDAANAGTSHANGAAFDTHEHGHTPSGGASGSSGENWAPSSFRLAGSYGPGYRGTGGGGGGNGGSPQGAVNPPASNANESQPSTEGPGSNTGPTDEVNPPPTTPEQKPEEPTQTPTEPTNPDEPKTPTGPGTETPPGGGDDETQNEQPPVSVPEPATLGLLGFGLAAMGYMRRRRASK